MATASSHALIGGVIGSTMAAAWVFTLPSAAIVGAISYGIAYGVGGTFGVIIV